MSTDTEEQPAAAPRRARDAIGGRFESIRNWWGAAPWWQRWIVYLLVILGAALLPLPAVAAVMAPGGGWTSVLFNPIGLYVLLALGLNIVVGQAGLLDLGYVAFYAIGAYTFAYLATKYGFQFWPTLVLGIGLAAVSGVILGAPTLRLRGDYLAIVTLGFGEIVRITAVNTAEIGGARGISAIPHPPSIFGLEFLLDPLPYYYLLLATIVIIVIFSRRLERSRVGRAWAAIREDEDAAELMGVPTFKFKLLAFAIGAMIGGLAGVVLASKVISISPPNFEFILSITILAAVLLGGAGNIPGVIFGAFLVGWLPEFLRGLKDVGVLPLPPNTRPEEFRILVFGAALVIMMTLRPEGILPSRRRRAELREGTGGMGAMGAEVAGPDGGSAAAEEVPK